MAKARMLHNKISRSIQVNKLSLPARLLFTWLISHADDEGRLRGEPEYIKATVVPMTKYSFKKIDGWLKEIEKQGLIFLWNKNNEQLIELVKWTEHQSIRKDRFIPSKLPRNPNAPVNQQTTSSQPNDNQDTTQESISESNQKEVKKSEYSEKEIQPNNNQSSLKSFNIVNPKDFIPNSATETAAYEVWQKLEPYNKLAFSTTYLKAAKRNLPAHLFYQFQSEILQDNSIANKGAIFNQKVKSYFDKKI